MAELKNNSARLIHVGAAMCIPGLTTTVPDGWLDSPRVKELMADGTFTNATTPPPPAPTARTVTDAGQTKPAAPAKT